MSAEASPEWLPAGWTVQYKFLKTGRRITNYVNLETGQKFFTKDDLLLTLRQTKAPSTKGHNNTAVNAYDRPEWLPENWSMEMKKYKSCFNIQKQRKIYVDPSTGSRFYSKPQVFRYLNHLEQKSSQSAQKKRPLHCTCKTVVPANERPEWLPNNWFVELKTHMSGVKMGRHYKIYVDPSTGHRFYSKPQVLRFLNNVTEKSNKSKQKKRGLQPKHKVVIENSTVDDFPAGWIKKVKITRNTNGVRRDPYYIDPASGYVFCSKKGALHYLQTGEISRHAFILKKKHIDDQNGNDTEKSLPAAKRQKVEHPATKQRLIIDVLLELKKLLESGTEKRNNINSKNYGKSKNKKELDLPRRFSTRLAQPDPELVDSVVKPYHNEANGPCVSEDKATQQINFRSSVGAVKQSFTDSTVKSCGSLMKTTIKSTEGENVQGKQSQMLESVKTSNAMSERQPLVCSDACLESSITAASNVLQEKNLGKKRMRSKSSDIKTKNSSKSKKMEELNLPRGSSKQLAQCVPELVANGATKEAPNQNVTTCSGENEPKSPCVLAQKAAWQLNVCPNPERAYQASTSAVIPKTDSIKPQGDKAILGQLPQMLGTHKGSDSKSELQRFLCSDPCLEFAIKTLTGAIPLEDAITEGLVSTPISNIQQQKTLAESKIGNRSCRKGLFNSTRSKKKDRSLPRASEQFARHDQEMVENSLSNEGAKKIAGRNACKSKGLQIADLTSENLTDKVYQQLKTDPVMAVEHHDCTYKTNIFRVGSSNKGKEPHQNQTAPTDMKNEKPGVQSAIPFGNPWSGSADSSISFESYFQQQFGSFGTQRGGNDISLPYKGLPNVSQSDISSLLDAGTQPVVQQHFPVKL